MSIIGKEEDVDVAVDRVKSITGGSELETYPGSVSVRVAVPAQAIPLLFPKGEVICSELKDCASVLCRPAPDEDSVSGFSVHGVDLSGATADVVATSRRIAEVIHEWVADKKIVAFSRRGEA